MSALSSPKKVVTISYFFCRDYSKKSGVLATECREDSLRNIFKMAKEAGYLENENRLDQLDRIQFCTQSLLEAAQNRPGPIHWYISNKTLYLTLKMRDVNTDRISTIYFGVFGGDDTWVSHPISPFTVLPQKTMIDNFKALLEGKTITVEDHPYNETWDSQYQFTLEGIGNSKVL